MLKSIMLVSALLLSGCSQTTVHLYSRYLTEQQINDIKQHLVAQDFVVKTNHLAFPASITQSAITYSPVIDDPKAVNTVLDSMQMLGWPIQHTSMLFVDNHWYKENSLALMLVPPDVDPQNRNSEQDIANQYISENCGISIDIHLGRDGRYEILSSDSHQIDAELTLGTWEVTEFPYLALHTTNDNWPIFFELKQYITRDQIGEIQITELSPLSNYSFLGGCTFKFGLRN